MSRLIVHVFKIYQWQYWKRLPKQKQCKDQEILFPLDLNDVQQEMKLFDDSENTDNSVGLPKHSGSIPDRIYHKLRVTPSNLAVFKLLYR